MSHSCRENILRDYQAHFGLEPDLIFGWDQPPEQRKPSPWPLEQIRKTYGLSPSQLLVVDDMKPAWEMCRKAGSPIAFAGWSKLSVPRVFREMEQICDYTFSSPRELEDFLF